MAKRLARCLLAMCLAVGLMPTLAFADEGGSSSGAGTVVEKGGVLIGATGCLDQGNRAPKYSDGVTYEIVQNNDDAGNPTYTLMFEGNGAIPDYYTENQGTAADGTEGAATPSWRVSADDKAQYPNGYVLDGDGGKKPLPSKSEDSYVFCTSEKAYYNVTPWNVTQYKGGITEVVFGEGVTGVGMNTLFNMKSVTHVEVRNATCKLSNNVLYYNYYDETTGAECTFDIPSTATFDSNKVHAGAKEGQDNATVRISDAAKFESETAPILSAMSEGSLSDDDKSTIEVAYETYDAGNGVFKSALGDGFVSKLKSLYRAATGVDPDAVDGAILGSTVHYELKSADGGASYELRFYESDSNGSGVVPSFYVKDSTNDPDKYQNAPWYASEYRSKIVKVTYDESITKTGALTSAHLYNCREIDFLNPDVEIVSSTIHYNDAIQADSVSFVMYSTAKASGSYLVGKVSGDDEPAPSNRAKISVRYFEAEHYKADYASLFSKSDGEATAEEVSSAKSAFDSLAGVCRIQLGKDAVPGGLESYLAKLNRLAAKFGLGESDTFSVVAEGPVPSSKGDAETVRYEVKSGDGQSYVVRFYDSDPNGEGAIPDYKVTKENSEERGSWAAYETLPWRSYMAKVKKMTFEPSIKYVGQFTAANLAGCTDYEILGEGTGLHNNAIYIYDSTYVPQEGMTIHSFSGVDVRYGVSKGIDDAARARIHFSYYEAEGFETSSEYAPLWSMDAQSAAGNSELIQKAFGEYSSLPAKAKTQLSSDEIAGAETTYAKKLSDLMAAIGLGGECGDGATYVLTQNPDGETYSLAVTGAGSVSSSPWAHKDSISSVSIEDGITGIGAGVFADLPALGKVDVAQSVNDIAEGAFPSSEFDIYGWLNHASGEYAAAHENANLKLKELRILCMGNSHTADYTQFLGSVLGDLSEKTSTKITFERLYPMGGRGLVISQGDRGNHYDSAHNQSDATYAQYQAAFSKTWDLVVAQDYHESTSSSDVYGGANWADEMQKAVAWLRDDAKGAKIAWFADWAEKSSNGGDLDKTYQQSMAAVAAVRDLGADGPDYIVPAATVLQNARTSFLGSTMNRSDVLLNNYKDNAWVFSDCAKDKMAQYTVLERDATHMSLELGRQLMATNFAYNLYQWLGGEIVTTDGFDFFGLLKTAPVFTSGEVYWQGEFTPEDWGVIKESCENAWVKPGGVTETSSYSTDPFSSMRDRVREIVGAVELPAPIDEESLKAAFSSQEVLDKINAIEGLSDVSADDVTVKYTAPVDGTEESPLGVDGGFSVSVDCHYGYSFSTEPMRSETIEAARQPGYDDQLASLKEKARNKISGYMSEDSYAEGAARDAVAKAKADCLSAIEEAKSTSEVSSALRTAEAAIDNTTTSFELSHQPDAVTVDCGQIWTGGWDHSTGAVMKNDFSMDISSDPDSESDSVFTGVWWVIYQSGDAYTLKFEKDDGTGYSYEIPAYNSNHWLDADHTNPSSNPLQYNKTPWMREYKDQVVEAVVSSGIKANTFSLACMPNVARYVVEDGASLGSLAIYFNPLKCDTTIEFAGAASVAEGAVSSYRVENSYAYYVNVEGDLSKVKMGSLDGEPLEDSLYYAFGTYRCIQYYVPGVGVYEPVWVGLAGKDGSDFAPHFTNGVDDGTDMLRVVNADSAHKHTVVAIPGKPASGCRTGLTEGSYCSSCGATVEAQQVIPAESDHKWDSGKITKEPDGENRGIITYTCETCGAEKTEWMDRHVHSLVHHEAVPATAESQGSVEYWSCGGCEKNYADEEAVEIIADTSTYAVILVSGAEGEDEMLAETNAGKEVNLPSPTREGYVFAGWNEEKDGSGRSYAAESTFVAKANGVVLYAQWTPEQSGGEVVPPKSEIVVPSIEGGSVTASPKNAVPGQKVTLAPKADAGHLLGSITVKDAKGNELELTDNGDGTFSFKMPSGKVTVEASFPVMTFPDVDYSQWYAPGVDFVAGKGLMTGYSDTGLFGVGKTLTRGELATILWRNACPDEAAAYDPATAKDATGIAGSADGQFYTAAANWAVANKVITGIVREDGSLDFAADEDVTFEQLVTILARVGATPDEVAAAGSDLSSFLDGSDASAWSAPSLKWAADEGLIEGYDTEAGKLLAPGEDVARERVATVLMRAFELGILK